MANPKTEMVMYRIDTDQDPAAQYARDALDQFDTWVASSNIELETRNLLSANPTHQFTIPGRGDVGRNYETSTKDNIYYATRRVALPNRDYSEQFMYRTTLDFGEFSKGRWSVEDKKTGMKGTEEYYQHSPYPYQYDTHPKRMAGLRHKRITKRSFPIPQVQHEWFQYEYGFENLPPLCELRFESGGDLTRLDVVVGARQASDLSKVQSYPHLPTLHEAGMAQVSLQRHLDVLELVVNGEKSVSRISPFQYKYDTDFTTRDKDTRQVVAHVQVTRHDLGNLTIQAFDGNDKVVCRIDTPLSGSTDRMRSHLKSNSPRSMRVAIQDFLSPKLQFPSLNLQLG